MDDVFEDLTDRPAAFTRALEVCATKRIDNAQQFIAREAYGFLRSCEVRVIRAGHSADGTARALSASFSDPLR